jgi:hypothetical protein
MSKELDTIVLDLEDIIRAVDLAIGKDPQAITAEAWEDVRRKIGRNGRGQRRINIYPREEVGVVYTESVVL